jgi:signal transduction histidine kinase/ligand-binding sensor domain-containing protein
MGEAGTRRHWCVASAIGASITLSGASQAYLAVAAPQHVEAPPPLSLANGGSLDEAAVRAWVKSDDLPSVAANAVAEAADGSVWITTEEGLLRFDGQGLRVLLRGEYCDTLVAAGDAILVAQGKAGLRLFKGSVPVDAAITRHTAGRHVEVLAEDGGRVLAGCRDGTVFDLGPEQVFLEVGAVAGLTETPVQALAARGSQIVVGSAGGLRFVDRTTGAVTIPNEPLANANVRGVAFDGSDLFVSTLHAGLWRCHDSSCTGLSTSDIDSKTRFGKMVGLSDGRLAVASTAGVVVIEHGAVRLATDRFRGESMAIGKTRDGSLWLGAASDASFEGVRQLRFRGVTAWRRNPDSTRSLALERNGSVLIGTETDGLWRHSQGGTEERVPLPLPGLESVRSLSFDPNGGLVVGGLRGVVALSDVGPQRVIASADMPWAAVRSVRRLADGTTVYGTVAGVLEQPANEAPRRVKDVTPTAFVLSFSTLRGGRLLVSTKSDGAFVRGVDGRYATVPLPAALEQNGLLQALELRTGELVLPGHLGLCLLSPTLALVRCFDERNGLRKTAHLGAIEDDFGRLWFPTNSGISSVSRDEFLAAARSTEPTPQLRSVRHFTTLDGMPVSECNGGDPNTLKLPDGRLVFACVGGAVVIDPRKARTDEQPPHVILESIDVDGETRHEVFADALSGNTQRVTFKYSAPAFLGDEKNQKFLVKLDGFDRDWVEGDRATLRASYTNLPRGRRLTFSVRATNLDGVWNENAASFTFTIAPRWYERLGVQAGGLFLLLGFLVGGYKGRTAQLKRRAESLEATVQERTRALVEERDRIASLEGRTKTLAETGRSIAASLEVDAIARTLREYVDANFDAPTYAVGLVDEDSRSLRYTGAYYEGRELAPYERSLDNKDQLAVWCVDHRAPVVIGDASVEASRFIGNYEAHANAGQDDAGAIEQSIVYLPLMSGDRCFGVITMQSPRKHAYRGDDVDVFLTLANYAATALANAQAYERIHGLLRELQSAQTQLVHAEKMAAFGRVAAGVAHEINNPLGAIRASAEGIGRVLEGALAILPTLIIALPDAPRSALFSLLARFRTSAGGTSLSARERRAKRREMLAVLEEARVPEAERAAELLTDAAVFELPPDELALLAGPDGSVALDVAHALGGAVRSVDLIREAVERTTKIVFALKNYSRSDRTGERTVATLAQGMDTVLTLYHNAMKAGVEVVRRVDEALPPIAAHHDELIQVWTNVVHNALQAMKYSGTLTIEVVGEHGGQRVSIGDSGTGIPPEVLPRIFEPFFTTKTAGEGTGLGLDICKALVEKHGGRIDVTTELGRGTTFHVWIPCEATP